MYKYYYNMYIVQYAYQISKHSFIYKNNLNTTKTIIIGSNIKLFYPQEKTLTQINYIVLLYIKYFIIIKRIIVEINEIKLAEKAKLNKTQRLKKQLNKENSIQSYNIGITSRIDHQCIIIPEQIYNNVPTVDA